MARVAFVGLGNMGQGMAGRLLEDGHQLKLFNRTAARAEALVQRGAQLFDSPREACNGVDAVISMVADDVASRAVWLEREGILADAMATSQAASPQVIRNTRRMVEEDHSHDIVFTSELRLKDVEYAVRFARAVGIGSPFGALAQGIYR